MKNTVKDRLLSFYEKKYTSRNNIKIVDLAKISDGWENEVYSYTVEHKEGTELAREDLILRIYPGDGASHKAEREFGGMKKLHEQGFPVPEVLTLELDDSYFGKPFVIMEKVNGLSLGQVIDESHDEKKLELVTLFCQMFVDLHALDWQLFIPDPSIHDTEDPYLFINRWLSEMRGYTQHFGMDAFDPILDWLEERVPNVPCQRLSVIHFDYHPHNILIQDDGKAFVIDWTCIDIGDRRMDLAWTLLLTSGYGNPESRQFVLDGYEQIAGHKIEQIEYFDVAVCFRRLFSMLVSINSGADKLGMRPEAVESMKQNAHHIRNVYTLMRERTAIDIPEIETLIATLS